MRKIEREKARLNEIEDVYRSLGLQSEEVLKYFSALASFPSVDDQEKKVVFIKAGTTSMIVES